MPYDDRPAPRLPRHLHFHLLLTGPLNIKDTLVINQHLFDGEIAAAG